MYRSKHIDSLKMYNMDFLVFFYR